MADGPFKEPSVGALIGSPATITTIHGSTQIPYRTKRPRWRKGWNGFIAAKQTNKLEFAGINVDHSFGDGEIGFFEDSDTWVRIKTPYDASIEGMQFGSDVGLTSVDPLISRTKNVQSKLSLGSIII